MYVNILVLRQPYVFPNIAAIKHNIAFSPFWNSQVFSLNKMIKLIDPLPNDAWSMKIRIHMKPHSCLKFNFIWYEYSFGISLSVYMQSLYHCMLYDITTSCMKVIILFEIDLNIRDRNSQNNNKGRRNSNCNVSFVGYTYRYIPIRSVFKIGIRYIYNDYISFLFWLKAYIYKTELQ